MRRLGFGSGGVASSRIALTMLVIASSWCETRRSSSSSFLANSLFAATISQRRTKARTTKTDISVARGVLRMVAAMMAPCSVNASGK